MKSERFQSSLDCRITETGKLVVKKLKEIEEILTS